MIHDYNSTEFRGVQKAVHDAERELKVVFSKVPLPDQGGR